MRAAAAIRGVTTLPRPAPSTCGADLLARRSSESEGGNGPRPVSLRPATADDAGAIHALVVSHLAKGHLLPRERDEIAIHAHRFVVAVRDDRVVACAELAPLSRDVSEVRSLVVSEEARSFGLGSEIIDDLVDRATTAGFEKLCAFTHAPSYFVHLGFSIVPHVWLPEKIVTDCHSCPHFRRCGQYAVLRELRRAHQACVPLAALHG
jgi:N-acetylglutamate synthase-like GNAT family acetyltransferase